MSNRLIDVERDLLAASMSLACFEAVVEEHRAVAASGNFPRAERVRDQAHDVLDAYFDNFSAAAWRAGHT